MPATHIMTPVEGPTRMTYGVSLVAQVDPPPHTSPGPRGDIEPAVVRMLAGHRNTLGLADGRGSCAWVASVRVAVRYDEDGSSSSPASARRRLRTSLILPSRTMPRFKC